MKMSWLKITVLLAIVLIAVIAVTMFTTGKSTQEAEAKKPESIPDTSQLAANLPAKTSALQIPTTEPQPLSKTASLAKGSSQPPARLKTSTESDPDIDVIKRPRARKSKKLRYRRPSHLDEEGHIVRFQQKK